MITWSVEKEEDGLSTLQWLQQRIPGAPRPYLRQMLRSAKVLCAGQPLTEDDEVRQGQLLGLRESQRLRELMEKPLQQRVEILFETREILVVYKPPQLAVHRGVGHEADNLAERVRTLIKQRREDFQTAPVHRLDAETSGPVLFGKGRKAISALGQRFMDGPVEKIYLGLAAGQLPPQGELKSPVVAKGKPREAATAFRRLDYGGGYSLLELQLHSGRKHQIRRQLADAGHPLAGDRRYRGPLPAELPRMFLHCQKLSFADPFSGRTVDVECPLPEDLTRALKNLI